MNILLAANAVGALASIVFALVGGIRPAALSESGTPTSGERFYGWMYATRGVPLGVAALVAPLAWPGPAAALVLCAAAAAQVGDAVIGIATRKTTMIAGASLLTAIHLATTVATA
ncbi:hypothetical protein [Streptomyces sp. MBT53]|uniref:hypothetical protein n=1 Tax=Streptomyces sp. MBT53 TaxID=1488384 RepID=UPI00191493AB|nr:hypothetical protein [Streptomyces sp. MBT53]MBK6018703.1 hypothetical protein [Streptomyces sp. MBT53]